MPSLQMQEHPALAGLDLVHETIFINNLNIQHNKNLLVQPIQMGSECVKGVALCTKRWCIQAIRPSKTSR